ncbi:GNAT family N-acetyltransferase [Vagococcus acidifermentans]|uniref:GNAT family N-acetyltransferase n=1 Tax=Vagococcus acidifermentans TaxID=564710 RepID=A0A430ARH0_9ENTE|nr:GNAT family protein [Vagococcus acidifermentans]RSU10651.1 GNAT family N-acetyltransferase [Vagococcus acidifermentans]
MQITTDNNLEIRSIQEQDIDELWKLAFGSNDLEWKNWNGPYFNDPIYTLDGFREQMASRLNRDDSAVILLDGRIIGEISWYWMDGSLKKWLEFGLVIYSQQEWCKGLGTQICKLWIDYIFLSQPNLQHLGFTTWSGNKRMMRIGEKLGMTLEARVRKVRYWQNRYFDSIKFGLLREEWQAQR